MDPTLLSLLDSIPQKPPRSKLETHRELIRQLRRKGCTYRDIVRILRERVGLDVAVSTIHSFIKVRAKHRKQVQYELLPLEPESSVTARMNPDDVASRITALKAKPVEHKAKLKHFHFEESEPLKLVGQGESR
ncbi:MAG: hypothetical protein WBV55_05075 [Candidatus Sulfotelmatobacter sp.]